ncbi:tripartite tricarboxylate transporter substrate binding protein [Brucellaceae bacterium VT-16-1752]|nr:tripartite tricarboxylate transporter substrate binding protein [Brucellaceae bacterium VT-16-1752]
MNTYIATLASTVLLLSTAGIAAAQELPVNNVRIIVPGGAGGGNDTATRIFADALKRVTGTNTIVTNQTAGGGVIAMQSMQTARADGSTLMVGHGKLHTQQIGGNTPLGFQDMTALGTISEINTAYAARSDAPYHTLAELVTYAKDHPNEIVMATESSGTSQVMGEALDRATGGNLRLVDFGSTSKRIPALIGNQAQVSMIPTGNLKQYVSSGDLKALAVLNDAEVPELPGVSTAKSQGVEISFPLVITLYGPPDMSTDTIEDFATAIAAVQQDAAFQDAIGKIGQNPVSKTPEETQVFLQAEYDFIERLSPK